MARTFKIDVASGATNSQVSALQSAGRPGRRTVEGEQPLQQLVDSINEGLLTVDDRLTITHCNRRFAGMLGYEVPELLGHATLEFMDEAARKIVPGKLAERKRGIADRYELDWRRKDGTTAPTLVSVRGIFDERARYRGSISIITDVTEIKEARAARDRLAAIVENAGDAIIGGDPDGIIQSWNKGAERLYDYSADEMVGKPAEMLAPPERKQEIAELIARAGRDEAVGRFETERITKAGERITVLITMSPIRDDAGTFVGVPTIARDITERRHAERTASAAAHYARNLIEASLDPLVTISRDGKITDVNEATVNATGMPREKLIGGEFCDYFTEPEKARAGCREAFEKGSVRDCALALRHRSGATIDVLCNAAVYRNSEGKIAGLFAAARDITGKKKVEFHLNEQRKHLEDAVQARTRELREANHSLAREIEIRRRAERSLRQHEQDLSVLYAISRVAEQPPDLEGRLRGVMHIAADAIGMDGGAVHLLEPDGETLTLRAWLGLSPEFLTALRTLKLGEGAAGAAALSKTPRVFDLSTFPTPHLLPLSRAEGTQTVIGVPLLLDDTVLGSLTLASKRPLPFLANELNLLSVVGRQIGHFIANAKLYDTAQREIHERELVQAQLEAANTELEGFSYSVSHDLRAPLRAIDGFSQILLEDYGQKLDDEGKRLLGVVRDGTVKMSRLIDDILAFSRAGRTGVNRESVDMEALVRSILAEQLAPALAGRKLAIDIGKLPAAHGDRAMLERVWSNLLDNAIKFTAPKPDARIAIGAGAGEGETVYSVRDNGVGFDMKYADKLFGVFHRLHGAEFPGTGIGLAIVKRIVGRHGGRVWAESQPGAGASFYFALPAKEASHA